MTQAAIHAVSRVFTQFTACNARHTIQCLSRLQHCKRRIHWYERVPPRSINHQERVHWWWWWWRTPLRAWHLWHLLTAIGGAIAAVAVPVVIGKYVVLAELLQPFLMFGFTNFMSSSRKHGIIVLTRVFLPFIPLPLCPDARKNKDTVFPTFPRNLGDLGRGRRGRGHRGCGHGGRGC